MKFEFTAQIKKKNAQISNFMEIRLVGAELFHADGRTDGQRTKRADRLTKIIVTFRNFANENSKHLFGSKMY